MSEKPSQSFWEKPKCVLDVDPDGPSILTITLMRKEEGEHIQYKRKFTILQSYGHSPCSYTASTAKLFHALKQANTKENKHSVIEEQLQKKEFSCYAHGFGNWLPFVDAEGPIPAEIASLRHPLSSTDGSKKWKLHLDMRGFAPDNVHISIVEKSAAPTLKIEMRRMVDGANYAYFRKIDIPPGVKLSKLKCRKQDGVLNVEAPFKPLPPACWR